MYSRLKELLAQLKWSMGVAWSNNALLLAAIALLSCLMAGVPAGLALVTRGLINAVVETLGTDSRALGGVLSWLAAGFALAAFQGVANASSRYSHRRLQADLTARLTTDVLAHASTLDLARFEDPRFQDSRERVQYDTAHHVSFFITNVFEAAVNLLQILLLLVILIGIEPLLVLVLVPVVIPQVLFQLKLGRRRFQIIHNLATHQRWTEYFVTWLTRHDRVPEIKILNLAPHFLDRFQALANEFRDEDRKLTYQDFKGLATFSLVSVVAYYATFVRVVVRAARGALTLGDVAVYAGSAAVLRNLMERTTAMVGSALEHMLHVQNFRDFLEISPAAAAGERLEPEPVLGKIEVRKVTFSYPGSDRPALSDVSILIEPGETVALVGENAAGKTTLAKLMARLYDPDEGNIFLDGVDLRRWSPEYLRSWISFVFQNFGKFEATVADNIAYGDWRRLLDDGESVREAARKMEMDEYIRDMPHGYETRLGKMFGEYNLSGGQWQNLAITRALARETRVLILDEPTSNLDARAEYRIFSRFRELSRGRTTILISHRFSTVSMADRIIMLSEGKVVEEGTHEELLKKAGPYAGLYRLHRKQMDLQSGE